MVCKVSMVTAVTSPRLLARHICMVSMRSMYSKYGKYRNGRHQFLTRHTWTYSALYVYLLYLLY